MLYVSGRDKSFYTVTDSKTGESFRTDDCGKLRHVLGYLDDGSVLPVHFGVINILGFIENIDFCDSDEYIRVCFKRIVVTDVNHIVFRISGGFYLHTVLDAIVGASYSIYFKDMLETGVLFLGFGVQRLSVKFCGNYKSGVAKAITMYKGALERERRVSKSTGYLI